MHRSSNVVSGCELEELQSLAESGGFESMSKGGGGNHESSSLLARYTLEASHLEKVGRLASLNAAKHLQGTVGQYQGQRQG